jgi:hypothetical protein
MSHPLLISLANLNMDFRAKASHHAFVLLALLPVPKFLHKKRELRGVSENRMIHECLDFILQPLKTAASIGVMMSDPWGGLCHCFTPLAGYIMDFQEAIVIAGVMGKTSPVTMANYKQFGDSVRHKPRTGSTTLVQLSALRLKTDAGEGNLAEYVHEAKKIRLNGVDQPFWRDWAFANPEHFLTPEPLHHWHKMSWDHDTKWCIELLGGGEIDFRFSVLHPHVGYRHFKEGISKLKQVTGREHRDIQRYIVGIIAGAAPKEFIVAIRALLDFRYLAQSPVIDEESCGRIEAALALFHSHKDSIIDTAARMGKGKQVIENWHIPKLELMQSVVPNIRENGAAIQWSADTTEHAHITEIKDPAHAGNNQKYESQITHHLDRTEKCRRFDLATSIREAAIEFGQHYPVEGDDNMEVDPAQNHHIHTTSHLLDEIDPVSNLSGPSRDLTDYFQMSAKLKHGKVPNALKPFRTFSVATTAFHLTRDANIRGAEIDAIAGVYHLDDLRPALADFMQRNRQEPSHIHNMSGRRIALSGCQLPFEKLHVWHRLRMQSKSYHDEQVVLPAQTVNALPSQGDCEFESSEDDWEFGRFDTVLVNTDPQKIWPRSGLDGASRQ